MRTARAHAFAGRLVALAAVAAGALAACNDRAGAADVAGGVPPVPAWSVPFTVRGRWEWPRELTYRCDAAGGRIEPEVFARTIRRALAGWSRTGVVGFRPARADEEPDVSFSWARGAHGTCRPFGVDFSVAHSGPVVHGTFVHFDAGHEWSPENGAGESLLRVAAHEAGHVLGLDHSPDPAALMYADATAFEPMPPDLAGLHSLYGGGDDGPGDLGLFARADDEGVPRRVAPDLRLVAPEERTAFALYDTDGDRSDELVVWRTDAEGVGALTVYHFDPGPLLARTVGPLLGVVPLGASPSFRTSTDGRRWIVSRHPDGSSRVRRFDDRGRLLTPLPQELQDVPAAGGGPAARPAAAGCPDVADVATGDLDGDGRVESVVRGPTGG